MNVDLHLKESNENKDLVDNEQQSWQSYTTRKLKKPLSKPLKRSIESVYPTLGSSSLRQSSTITSQYQKQQIKVEPLSQKPVTQNGIIRHYCDDNGDNNLQFEEYLKYGDFAPKITRPKITPAIVVVDSDEDAFDWTEEKIEGDNLSSYPKPIVKDEFAYLKYNKKKSYEENNKHLEKEILEQNNLENGQHEIERPVNSPKNETNSLLQLYEEKTQLEITLLKKKIEKEDLQMNLMHQGKLHPLMNDLFSNIVAQTGFASKAGEQPLEVQKKLANIEEQNQ